jgi:hypothetical protein
MKIPGSNVKFVNKGHTVEVNDIENGTLAFGGNTYVSDIQDAKGFLFRTYS